MMNRGEVLFQFCFQSVDVMRASNPGNQGTDEGSTVEFLVKFPNLRNVIQRCSSPVKIKTHVSIYIDTSLDHHI